MPAYLATESARAMGSVSSPTAADLAGLPRTELVARHRFGVEALDGRLFELDDEQLDRAFLADVMTESGKPVGKWPVRVLLGHLADAELVFAHRIRRTLAEDRPMLSVWDEMAFVDSDLYAAGSAAPVAGFVATVHTLRRWQSELLMSLTEQQWHRTAMHPEQGELSLGWLVAYAAWHFEHHARFLRAKVEHMLGPRPPAEEDPQVEGAAQGCCQGEGGSCACNEQGVAKPAGGCGSGCGCAAPRN